LTATPSPPSQSTPAQRRNALIAVAGATIIQTVAQLLIKQGTNQLGGNPALTDVALGMFTVPPLFFGYALYGLVTVIMIFALKHGELSMLYPVMALGYIWVPIASVVFFHEPVSAAQIAGICVIVGGVAVLGRGAKGGTKGGIQEGGIQE
jgi:multidrug transporter EmrE-like cation transporter